MLSLGAVVQGNAKALNDNTSTAQCNKKWRIGEKERKREREAQIRRTYLAERLCCDLHHVHKFTQLAVAKVARLDPMVQALLMHKFQCAGTETRRDQRLLGLGLRMADPADDLRPNGGRRGARTGAHFARYRGRHRFRFRHRWKLRRRGEN